MDEEATERFDRSPEGGLQARKPAGEGEKAV
jgi:hypothetical protein